MYKIAICDDCREALREIEKLLRRYIEKNKIRAVVEAYQSQMQLLTELESGRYYDIIFMDIKMPGMNGLEVLKRIREMNSVRAAPARSGKQSPKHTILTP